MKKRILSMVLALFMVVSVFPFAFAQIDESVSAPSYIPIFTEEEVEAKFQQMMEKSIQDVESETSRSRDFIYRTVNLRIHQSRSSYARAGGQLPLGWRNVSFFSWTSGGSNTTVTFTAAWAPATASMAVGRASTAAGAGIGVPAQWRNANTYVALEVNRTFETRMWDIERSGDGGRTWQRVSSNNRGTVPLAHGFRVVRTQ